MKIKLIATIVAAAGISASAFAADANPFQLYGSKSATQGFYIKAMGGTNYLQKQYAYDDGGVSGLGAEITYKWGWNAGISAGYQINPHWQVEGNISYLYNSLKEASNSTFGTDRGHYTRAWTYMANAEYSFLTHSQWTPYAGLGLGAATVRTKFSHAGSSKPQNSTAFAYQGILGLAYNINSHVNVFGEYRHLGTSEVESRTPNTGGEIKTYYQNNLFDIGVRYLF